MILELDYFRKLKENIKMENSTDFDKIIIIIYNDLHKTIESIKNTDVYKKDVADKFNKSVIPLKDKDMDTLIKFFQENPIDLYNMILDTTTHIKNMCVNKDIDISSMGIILYNKLKSECKNNIELITDDFNSKYENGYFDKEEF